MPDSPGRPDTRIATRQMLLMGAMMAGAGTVDTVTATMLPITAKHFTGNITLIAVMVALNRVCGFLVQPYAAWRSDSHGSPRGRRRPFLLGAWPAVFLSVGILGGMPFLLPSQQLGAGWALVIFFAANLVMQAGLDFCYGTGDPMYGDAFTSGELGRANAIRMIVGASVGVAMTFVFVPLADTHEFWPYAGAMLFVAVSYFVARFFIREKIPAHLPRRVRYHPLKPLAELRNPQTRNVAICASAVLVALALTEMLHALFVTETLGFSKTVLGYTTTAAFVISFAMPYPVGWLVDRVGARTVLVVGFALLAAVEAGFVFWVDDLASLYVGLILFKVSWVVVHLPIVPLMFHNTPLERRGSIFAAVQMTRAGVTSIATIVAGYFAGAVSSYRVCYLVAGIVCVIGLFAALKLAPVKRRDAAVPALV
jgi:MFS family permease